MYNSYDPNCSIPCPAMGLRWLSVKRTGFLPGSLVLAACNQKPQLMLTTQAVQLALSAEDQEVAPGIVPQTWQAFLWLNHPYLWVRTRLIIPSLADAGVRSRWFASPQRLRLSTPIQLAQDVQFTNYVINLAGPGLADTLNADITAHANLVYQHFDDHFDFLIFVPQFPLKNPSPAGFFDSAANDVQNIGEFLYDGTVTFGSEGQLQGAIDNADIDWFTLLIHELMHRVAGFV